MTARKKPGTPWKPTPAQRRARAHAALQRLPVPVPVRVVIVDGIDAMRAQLAQQYRDSLGEEITRWRADGAAYAEAALLGKILDALGVSRELEAMRQRITDLENALRAKS